MLPSVPAKRELVKSASSTMKAVVVVTAPSAKVVVLGSGVGVSAKVGTGVGAGVGAAIGAAAGARVDAGVGIGVGAAAGADVGAGLGTWNLVVVSSVVLVALS